MSKKDWHLDHSLNSLKRASAFVLSKDTEHLLAGGSFSEKERLSPRLFKFLPYVDTNLLIRRISEELRTILPGKQDIHTSDRLRKLYPSGRSLVIPEQPFAILALFPSWAIFA
jgi:hypothetical protein